MFEECDNLSEVITDLSSIKNGKNMFRNCSSLKLGKIDLSSLEDAEGMFYGCKLDGETVASIIDTINANEQTPRIDIGVTIDGLKSFYDNACYISFDDFVHEYEGREYHVYINEPIEKVEDLGYNYIQYDDDGAMIDSIPEDVWSSIEDTSGFFINNMTITTFDHNLPKVKRACGMFNNVRTLTSFNGDVQNLENAAGMFQYSGLLKFNKPLRNCLVLDYTFSNTPITSFTSDCGKLTSAYCAFVHCASL